MRYFVAKDIFNGLFKYLLPIIGFFMAGTFAYGWQEIQDRTSMKSSIIEIRIKQKNLDSTVIEKLIEQAEVYKQFNGKLDVLLNR